MRLVKCKTWTHLSDAKYCVLMPINVIKTIPAILAGEPKLNEMTWRDYIGMAKTVTDMQCGRMWKEEASP